MRVFTPAPMTTASGCPGTTSARMPQSLPPSRSTSFGHFRPALCPVPRSWPITARVIAAPAMSGIQPRARAGCRGPARAPTRRAPVPGGAVQVRSRRPRPVALVGRQHDRQVRPLAGRLRPRAARGRRWSSPVDSMTCRRGLSAAAERGYPSERYRHATSPYARRRRHRRDSGCRRAACANPPTAHGGPPIGWNA